MTFANVESVPKRAAKQIKNKLQSLQRLNYTRVETYKVEYTKNTRGHKLKLHQCWIWAKILPNAGTLLSLVQEQGWQTAH